VTIATAAIARAEGGHRSHTGVHAGVSVSDNVGGAGGLNVGASATVSANANGGVGHTPVTICHWVPAHGGSYVTITIDDDGLHGHGVQHENDIIPAPATGCPGAQVQATETAAVEATGTTSPVATATAAAPTSTATSSGSATATSTSEGAAGGATSTFTAVATATAGSATGTAQSGVLGASTGPNGGVSGATSLPNAGDGSGADWPSRLMIALVLAVAGSGLTGAAFYWRRAR